jgi:diguanylate cyclase (GGDEF)-like protein
MSHTNQAEICPADHSFQGDLPGPEPVDAARAEIEWLRTELDRLQRELTDVQNSLITSNEHGDVLQEHLYRTSISLGTEVRERQAAEQKLQALLDAVSREKGDLEVLVQILIEQGDTFAEEGEKARLDSLTRIPNRRRFDEVLSKEWTRHARHNQPISLLLCDVDHFKLFNDRYGHQEGDECLKAVARLIESSLREDDLAARYGGEEFGIILPHTPATRARHIAEEIRSAVVALKIEHATSPVCNYVTLSIGIACTRPDVPGTTAAALVRDADRNLYLAKDHGRNRLAITHYERETGSKK